MLLEGEQIINSGISKAAEGRSMTQNAQVLSSDVFVLPEAGDQPDHSSWCCLRVKYPQVQGQISNVHKGQ